MENSTCKLDPHDEVRKLQDKVRKLELQNEQLRSQQFSRNGLLENRQSILARVTDSEYFKKRLGVACQSLDDNLLKQEEIEYDDFLNEETWLMKAKKEAVDNTPHNLMQWLRQDLDNQNEFEMQRIRRMLLQRIEEIEQGVRRNNIDTRTFTRSKKRMCRPSLETMSESPILENKVLFSSPWQRLSTQITETIDDFSLQLDNTFPSLITDTPNLNTTFCKSDIMGLNSFQKMASEPRLNTTSEITLDAPFLKSEFENQEPNTPSQKSSDSDLSTNSRKASDPCLNTTYQKPHDATTILQMPVRSRSITPSGLNCTFSLSGRNPSCDSGADDDQLSSASDSSMSSSARLMNVGDVQNIARIQEESLKQVMSTPKRTSSKDGSNLTLGEDLPSPILRSNQDLNHGYLSDHSDHSSAEGRVRSSRSSVRSSPAGSPFGSTQVLINDCAPSIPMAGLPRRELKLIPSNRKQEIHKSESVTRKPESGRGRPMSGLRPPAMVRSQGVTGIARPSTGGSGIPRPQSRIPGPRTRSTTYAAQPANKLDWMDGCY